MNVLQISLGAYAAVACGVFLYCILFGKILKKVSLGGGTDLGLFNSLVVSILWPITLIVSIIGFVYEVVQWWRKL